MISLRSGVLRVLVPWWLSDRPISRPGEKKKNVGYRFLYTWSVALDAGIEALVQAWQAPMPGKGTATAMPFIGRNRGLIKAQDDTEESYAARLRKWLDPEQWPRCGQMYAVARRTQEYLSSHPRIRVVNRAGVYLTLETDGTYSITKTAWDWDSVSHPERNDPAAPFWSELFVIVYTDQFPICGNWGADDDDDFGDRAGFGHEVAAVDYYAEKGLLAVWKSAHTKIRAVIWCTDPDLFDPEDTDTLPDGTWGQWSERGGDIRVASGRNLTSCRYWEPGRWS